MEKLMEKLLIKTIEFNWNIDRRSVCVGSRGQCKCQALAMRLVRPSLTNGQMSLTMMTMSRSAVKQ